MESLRKYPLPPNYFYPASQHENLCRPFSRLSVIARIPSPGAYLKGDTISACNILVSRKPTISLQPHLSTVSFLRRFISDANITVRPYFSGNRYLFNAVTAPHMRSEYQGSVVLESCLKQLTAKKCNTLLNERNAYIVIFVTFITIVGL